MTGPTSAYWVSWCHAGDFEYQGPWWISGYDAQDRATICAAVTADTEATAATVITNAHDDPTITIDWRFIEPCPAGWSPFTSRFPRADWMVWA